MGIGDELMMSGEVRRRAAGTKKRFLMLDKRGKPKWHPIWEGQPNIVRPGEPHDETLGYDGRLRPYIADCSPERYVFRAYTPVPAQIRLGYSERALGREAAGAIVFNPTIKERASPNKDWGLARWQHLVQLAPDLDWLCIGENPPHIDGAKRLRTVTFLEACGVLSGAAVAVLHEGGLHHAAAALGVPAVVIYGGFISPRVTGYEGQTALYVENKRYPYGCGQRVPCAHCREAMESIEPLSVLQALRAVLATKDKAIA